MALVPAQYFLYRNGTLVASGVVSGSAQLAYTPPDASPATYTVRFLVSGAVTDRAAYVSARGMSFVGYRR